MSRPEYQDSQKKVNKSEYDQLVSEVEFLEVMFEAQAIGSTDRTRPPPQRTFSEPVLLDHDQQLFNGENETVSMPIASEISVNSESARTETQGR